MRSLEEVVKDYEYHIGPFNTSWSGNPLRDNNTSELEKEVLHYLKEYLCKKKQEFGFWKVMIAVYMYEEDRHPWREYYYIIDMVPVTTLLDMLFSKGYKPDELGSMFVKENVRICISSEFDGYVSDHYIYKTFEELQEIIP